MLRDAHHPAGKRHHRAVGIPGSGSLRQVSPVSSLRYMRSASRPRTSASVAGIDQERPDLHHVGEIGALESLAAIGAAVDTIGGTGEHDVGWSGER